MHLKSKSHLRNHEHLYRPIILIRKSLVPSSNRQINDYDSGILLEDENGASSASSPLIRGGDCGRRRSKTAFCKNWKMGLFSATGFCLVVIIWLISSSRHNVTECCNPNMSQSRIHLWPFYPSEDGQNEIDPTDTSLSSSPYPEAEIPFDSKKVKVLEKIRHKMMSVSLKYILDFILRSENFKFSCPSVPHPIVHSHSSNETKIDTALVAYPDQLDCRKYYVCNDVGRFTPGICEEGHGFDKKIMKCVNSTQVQLCNDVGIFRGFNCTTIGLHPFIGDCNRFVLCTQEKVAYVANCNPGYFFDSDLLICLPSTESEC